jgi:transposase
MAATKAATKNKVCKRIVKVKNAGPDLTSVRRFLKGVSHRRGVVETRGAKRKLTHRQLQKINTARKKLYTQAKGEGEVHYDDILEKAGLLGVVDRTTVAKNLKDAGYPVQARPPREKPCRTDEHDEERVRICKSWRRKPKNFFTKKVHIIIDNKLWEIPITLRAKRYKRMRKVRFHIRTRSEGLAKNFTKPSGKKKQRINPGASVSVVAGIVGCRIRLWHYLPKKRWNAKVAAAVYQGPIKKVLRRHCGRKKEYLILEDNDPTGYKSKAAIEAKRKLSFKAVPFPRYSPDLNPLDFSLWHAIETRMDKNTPKKKETVEEYKKRLRRTALATPKHIVRKAVMNILPRALAVIKELGGNIPRD